MEHEAQTKADWEDVLLAWRRKKGGRPQAHGSNSENGQHQPPAEAVGETGRTPGRENTQRVDRREDQTCAEMIPQNTPQQSSGTD